jgi:glucokinase
MSHNSTLGIDIGGTNIKAGVYNPQGKLLTWRKIASEMHNGRDHVIARIEQLVGRLRKKHHLIPVLGVVVAGIINRERTRLIHSPNLPGWDDFDIKETLEKALQCTVTIENDANGAALGELWKGEGRNRANFVLLTLGTGLGSGIIIEGKLWTGEDGTAAEMGHTKIVPYGLKCGCGARGCLERYFSNGAIERLVKKELKTRKKTQLRSYSVSEAISPRVVYQAARSGDAVALSIFREISKYLGIAISNVINLLAIRTFILSGGISNASPVIIPMLTEEVNRNLFFPFSKDFLIMKGKLGNRAGAAGAAYLALNYRKRNPDTLHP